MMSRGSVVVLSPQEHAPHGLLDALSHCFDVQHFSESQFAKGVQLQETIVLALPGVDLRHAERFMASKPLFKVFLKSAGVIFKSRSGWSAWDFEDPHVELVRRLELKFKKLAREQDTSALALLHKTLAEDGEAACVHALLNLWKSWTGAENVLWVPNSDVLLVEDQRKTSLDPNIRSLVTKTEQDIKNILMQIAPAYTSAPRAAHFQCHAGEPLGWVRSSVNKGVFLFERPLFWKEPLFLQRIQDQGDLLKLIHQFAALRRQTVTDDLTGLYNHRHLFPCLEHEIERTAQLQSQFSVLFIDVDRFKQVNDHYGHLVGSELLSQLGGLLRRKTRASDLSFRYGGDEYLIILRGAKGVDALAVGERLRRAVDEADFRVGEKVFKLTLSIGVSTYPENATTSDEIIRIADEAMYTGKRKSRNTVQRAA